MRMAFFLILGAALFGAGVAYERARGSTPLGSTRPPARHRGADSPAAQAKRTVRNTAHASGKPWDAVDEASDESFPASDPPAKWSGRDS